jgi:Trypsin-co-occurring domain 1
MATRFLELKDGVIVEIGSPGEAREEMHTSSAERVDTTMEMVATMLDRILRPIGDAFAGLHEALDVPVAVDAAEVKLGLSFSAEGNLFVAKSKAEGTLSVRVTFKPVKPGSAGAGGQGAPS